MTELNIRQSQKEFYIISISFKRKSYSNSTLKARAEIGKDFLYFLRFWLFFWSVTFLELSFFKKKKHSEFQIPKASLKCGQKFLKNDH